jgi:hypothetical protein
LAIDRSAPWLGALETVASELEVRWVADMANDGDG